MEISYFIHWLGTTLPWQSGGLDEAIITAAEFVPRHQSLWIATKPQNGYRYAARTQEGVRVLCGREDMGIHIELPGEALASVFGTPEAVHALIKTLNERSATFSRIDVSIDAVESGLAIDALHAAVLTGTCDTKAQRHRHILSNDDGQTLYIGAPASDAQLRIYNKAAERRSAGELPDTDDWIRIELQLRRHNAHSAGMMIAATPDMAVAVRSLILNFADFPGVYYWTRVMHGTAFQMGHSTRSRGNVRKWLLSACAVALAREIYLDKSFKREFERSVRAALDTFDKNGS